MIPSLADSYEWCKSLSKRTAGNFYFAFWTLPPEKFRDMCVLYAFMRVSDDLGDDDEVAVDERKKRLSAWRESLLRALGQKQFDHPVFPALAEVVHRYAIPHEYLYAVLDGIDSDLESNSFETFDDLNAYCYRVAGAVGLCCLHIWGFHDDRAIAAAIDCGTAFQLTNILRDLAEDSAMGRIYLPQEDLQQFEYTRKDLVEKRVNDAFRSLMQFEAARARSYYERAEQLHQFIDPVGKPILSTMLATYGGLLKEMERRHFDVFRKRVQLSRWRKLMIAIREIVRHRWFGAGNGHDKTMTSER